MRSTVRLTNNTTRKNSPRRETAAFDQCADAHRGQKDGRTQQHKFQISIFNATGNQPADFNQVTSDKATTHHLTTTTDNVGELIHLQGDGRHAMTVPSVINHGSTSD